MGKGPGLSVSCGVCCRRSSDPELLWLWCRPVATAPIRALAWEPPHAAGAAKKAKQNKTGNFHNGSNLQVFLKKVSRSSRRGAVVNESD